MTKMQTNSERAAGYRELQSEFVATGKVALAEKSAKRAEGFEALTPDSVHSVALPTNNLEDAIDAEARDWADFFEANTFEQLEARRIVMRANTAVGYFVPLKGYYRGA